MTSRLSTFTPTWGQLNEIQREMNRLFERWSPSNGWLRNFAPSFPAVNVWEDQEAVYAEAELPGLDIKDLEIYVSGGNQLTLKGERKPPQIEKGVWHRQERGQGQFVRVLTLPFAVDADKVEAHFDNGVLRVKLAKHEAAKPRKITVKAQ